jgi:hypothetical protein
LIFRMLHIGLCNSVMGWKRSSENHDKAAFLIMYGCTFFSWLILDLLSISVGIKISPDSNYFLFMAAFAFAFSWGIVRHSLKLRTEYRKNLTKYRSASKLYRYAICTMAIAFVFLSFAIFLIVSLYVRTI